MSKIIVSGNEKEEKRVTEDTQEVLNQKFQTDVGQKAVVERETFQNTYTDQIREVLQDIGRDVLEHTNTVPKGMEYMGSMAVHIYRAPSLGAMAFYSQLAYGRTTEDVVSKAIGDLRNAAIESFGHKRQKLRSGF